MASLSFYQGGEWCKFPYAEEPRKPKIQVTYATPQLVKFTLTDTDSSIANAIRRIIMAEIPTMAIETVNVLDNDSVMFDEFIAHRLGLLPLSSHDIGDIPPDEAAGIGFREHKDCNCFDGCPYCTVEFKLDVTNHEDKILNVTHFDVVETKTYQREISEHARVKCVPLRNEKLDITDDTRDNGVLICKLKKNQRMHMVCHARKGIPKYHSKFMPVATCCMRYQPIVQLKEEMVNSLTLDEKVEFVESCPRKVFGLDGEKLVIEKLQDCIFCDECVALAQVWGKKEMVTIKQDANMFHFIVESVTPDGPRSVIDVVRAAFRVFDYKLQNFVKDTWGDEIKDFLPREPR